MAPSSACFVPTFTDRLALLSPGVTEKLPPEGKARASHARSDETVRTAITVLETILGPWVIRELQGSGIVNCFDGASSR